MAVVIVHYHLSPGGVTRVVESSSQCLTRAGIPHVILCGEVSSLYGKLPHRIVEGLGYLTEPGSRTAMGLVHEMRDTANDALGPGPHIWHFHNHSLGVNPLLSDVVDLLARDGEKMVLQIHDLAEEGRPRNYPVVASSQHLYPVAPHIRYAFLNSRDRLFFHQAGLPLDHSLVLPNPISAPSPPHEAPSSSTPPLIIYPVRGIRRKNLGELFLLAAVSPPGARYALTLAPIHPRWKPHFEAWTAFAKETTLPVELDVVGKASPDNGENSSFEAWLEQATHIVTTSVSEGFGMGFLEAAALRRPLFGRNLPVVTEDHEAAGMTVGRLYDRILVPLAWIGLEQLRQHLARCLQDVLDAYGHQLEGSYFDKVFDSMRFKDRLDFGNLPEDLQRHVIRHVIENHEQDSLQVDLAGAIQPLVPWLAETLANRVPSVSPEQLAPYSQDAYEKRLVTLYNELKHASAELPGYLQKHYVLNQYLKASQFHFLLS